MVARILVVDDSRYSRGAAVRALREGGHQVWEAHDGAMALEAVGAEAPDCVVLDMLMPVMDGIEFLRRLRASGSTLPVVALSADIQSGTRQLCFDLGVIAFLHKPAKPDELRVAVARALLASREEPACP